MGRGAWSATRWARNPELAACPSGSLVSMCARRRSSIKPPHLGISDDHRFGRPFRPLHVHRCPLADPRLLRLALGHRLRRGHRRPSAPFLVVHLTDPPFSIGCACAPKGSPPKRSKAFSSKGAAQSGRALPSPVAPNSLYAPFPARPRLQCGAGAKSRCVTTPRTLQP